LHLVSELFSSCIKLRILVLLTVSTLPYVVKVNNYFLIVE
jgi:hypothetical protein